MGPKPNDYLIRESQDTQGRILYGYGGRNWSDTGAGQISRMAGNYWKLKRGKEGFSSPAF